MKRNPSARTAVWQFFVLARPDTSGLQKGKRQETAPLASPWTAKKHQPQSQCNISQIGVFSKQRAGAFPNPCCSLKSVWTNSDVALWYQGVSAQVHTVTLPWLGSGWGMPACLLTPLVCEQAQVSRHGCHKLLSPSKCIVMSSSGAKEGTMPSLQPPKLKTKSVFPSPKQEGSQEKENRLEPGREADLHSYWDKAKGSTGTWWQCWDTALGAYDPQRLLSFPPFRRHKLVCSFLTLNTSCTWMLLTVPFVKKLEAQTKHLPYAATWCDIMWHTVPAVVTTYILK